MQPGKPQDDSSLMSSQIFFRCVKMVARKAGFMSQLARMEMGRICSTQERATFYIVLVDCTRYRQILNFALRASIQEAGSYHSYHGAGGKMT